MLLLGVSAAVLLASAETATIYRGEVSGKACEDAVAGLEEKDRCVTTGGEQHSFALALIAVLVGVMSVGAGIGGSRPAAAAVLAAGLVVLGITLFLDLPDTTGEGPLGLQYDSARAVKGPGFWFELVGGGLAVASGLLRLLWRGRKTEAG